MIIDKNFNINRNGKKVVYCSGCFDLLHKGHLEYLGRAKQCGDILIAGVAGDILIKLKKGIKRPIIKQKERVIAVDLVPCVDYTILIDRPSLLKFGGYNLSLHEKIALSTHAVAIKNFKPDVCFFSSELHFTKEAHRFAQDNGFALVQDWGKRITSTTEIIKNMKNDKGRKL